jgi:hypothetical protein
MPIIIDLWAWYYEQERLARISGDAQRLMLAELNNTGFKTLHSDPQKSLAMFKRGAEIARQLGEPCWELFYEYWYTEVHIFSLLDATLALQESTRVFAIAHRPEYMSCVVRGRVYITLVAAYYRYDPESYDEEIRNMLEDIYNKIPCDDDTIERVKLYRILLDLVFDRYDQCESMMQEYISDIRGNAFREADAFRTLGVIAYAKRDFSTALAYVLEGQKCSLRSRRFLEKAMGMLMEACLMLHLGETEKAQGLYERGIIEHDSASETRAGGFYDWVCEYLQLTNQFEQAMRHRDEELLLVQKCNHPRREAISRLSRARLFGMMNNIEARDQELAEGHIMLNKLKKCDHLRSKFERVANGDYNNFAVDAD